MHRDKGQEVRQPCLRIEVVHLGGDNEATQGSGSLIAAVRPAEHPRFASQRDAAQRPLGGIVRQAHAPIVEEQRECGPAFQYLVDGLGEIVATRELGSLLAQVDLKFLDQLLALSLTNHPALLRVLPLMDRSISNRASMRRTTSMAIDASTIAFLPAACRRAFSYRSAMAKNGRLAWTQHAASTIGPGR